MTFPGSRPSRPGFLAKFQAAMVPVVPPDDGEPIVRPRGVTIASVLAMIAGVIFLLVGALTISQADAAVDLVGRQYQAALDDCTKTFGGYGTTLATPTQPTLTSSAALCRSGAPLTEQDKDGYRTSQQVIGVIFVVIGVLVAVAGWFLRNGAKWAKRTLVTVGALLLLAAALLRLSTSVTLLGTLLLAAAIVLTYVGRSSLFFLRVAQRKQAH